VAYSEGCTVPETDADAHTVRTPPGPGGGAESAVRAQERAAVGLSASVA
jgi:hypothetical protein